MLIVRSLLCSSTKVVTLLMFSLSRQSSCSSIVFDGLHTPFSQSLSNHNLSGQAENSAAGKEGSADARAPDEEVGHQAGQSRIQERAWTVNEMLPVIHEEREKSRNASSASMSSDSHQNTVRSEAGECGRPPGC